jgi:hypothetical protein
MKELRERKSMNIELDADSKQWIQSKGSQLTVKTLEVKACCAPGVQELVAVPGKPKTVNQFNEVTVENLSIYVQKSIRGKEKLILTLSGFGFFKSISAKLQ